MTKLAITPLIAIGLAAAAAAILPAPPVSAAGPASGPGCLSDELGNTATSSGGTTVTCLADPQGGYSRTADTSAAGTIKQWQERGYTVNIDRVGTAPLDKCIVTGVRNPLTITRLNREDRNKTNPGELVPIVVSKTISISLDCAGHS